MRNLRVIVMIVRRIAVIPLIATTGIALLILRMMMMIMMISITVSGMMLLGQGDSISNLYVVATIIIIKLVVAQDGKQ